MALNSQQQEILDLPMAQPVLVLAGAGSGKTTVVAHRAIKIAALLPSHLNLQLLTFANKAAKEMKERIKKLGCSDLSQIRFDTFHSFGMKLIRNDPAGFNLTEGFSLLNETDVKRSLTRLAKAFNLPAKKELEPSDRKRLDPMAWLNTWSLARQDGYDVNNSANTQVLLDRLVAAHALTVPEQYIAWKTLTGYEQEKRGANSLDFDDLIYLPLLRLARSEEFRSAVRAEIGHVMVDEYQDTNRIQFELFRRIALGYCGVTCVGDDDQSIYGWRGAKVSNMKRFVSNFNATELRLERNYRSTKAIVAASVDLIRHNETRLEKLPFSEGPEGEDLELFTFEEHREMADTIAKNIASSIASGTPPCEIAVLYRTNRMAMLLEQGLRRSGVPYHVVGGMSLFDRSEVTAVTSALRVARNPKDQFAIKTLVDYVDGFGDGSAYALCEWLDENAEHSLANLPDSLPNLSAKKLDVFRRFYHDLLDEALLARDPNEFIQWVVNGPMCVLDREKNDEIRERKSHHLDALGRDIQEELEERFVLDPKLTWRDVMIEVALRDVRQSENEQGQVTLSTIHRSKGLEWSHIHVAGASEGLMPLDSKSEVNAEDAGYSHLEEERRLAFVALTRAKQVCKFYHANHYGFAGSTDDRTYDPSRFLSEMKIKEPTIASDFSFDDSDDDFDFESLRSAISATFAPRAM